MKLYLEDGILPGLEQHIIQDAELDPEKIFGEETAGFMDHPAAEFRTPSNTFDVDSEPATNDSDIMLEKMGVSDPESENFGGCTFTASVLHNLVKNLDKVEDSNLPDLVIHNSQAAICEYNNPNLVPGMFLTLFPFGIGGFEDKARQTGLSFQQQAQYYLNIPDCSFQYHYSFIFIILNIWQRRAAHLHTSFTVKNSKFNSVA